MATHNKALINILAMLNVV